MKTTILKRIRRAEVLAKQTSSAKHLARCTCFPEHGKSPYFLYPGIEELASSLKCPLHGDRFRYSQALDADASAIDLEVGWVWRHASEQYRKAWNATFQDSAWPTEEIQVLGRKWLLPRNPQGELMDWQNASPLPPWKRAYALALTLETY
jgi:hypothetical protein